MTSSAPKTLYVKGMHCAACESLIEQKFKDKPWVKEAKASLSNNKVSITTDGNSNFSLSDLNNEFKEFGYTFYNSSPKSDSSVFVKTILIVIATVILFYLNEKNGFMARFTVDSTSGYLSYFIFGLAAGASSCAALTGSILLSMSKTWGNIYSKGDRHVPFTLFNFGRLLSFALFGGILGAIGSAFSFNITATAVFTIVVSLLMAILGLQMLDIKFLQKVKIKPPRFFTEYSSDQKNFVGKYVPLLIGAMTFFLPCGFTIVAQTNALATGSVTKSSLIMLSFALGTLPMLALISFTSIKFFSHSKFSQIFSYTAGILVFFFALYTINSQLNVLGAPSLSSIHVRNDKELSAAASSLNENRQIIEMYAEGFEYFPKYIEVEQGKPALVKFYNNGAFGCATSIAARGLIPGTIHIEEGYNEFEINTSNAGTYKLTCSMGMVPPVTIVVK